MEVVGLSVCSAKTLAEIQFVVRFFKDRGGGGGSGKLGVEEDMRQNGEGNWGNLMVGAEQTKYSEADEVELDSR